VIVLSQLLTTRTVEFVDMIQRRNDDFLKTRARRVKRCVNGVEDDHRLSWISRTGSGRVVLQKEGYERSLIK
jgi:hypothetical protein